MVSRIDDAFGINAKALETFGRRAEVLAGNMANADTPGYKARDIDFKSVLGGVMKNELPLAKTAGGHMATAGGGLSNGELLYRVPLQPSADGNTVDMQMEQAQFAQNAIRYQTSITFLDGTIKNLLSAIRGE
ncbi:MAG: flagellar basal body rod protein FlgB [Gammaproteobacteria bacterium]|nr:flagellar basal body rod protein FlgB [Gammaproteobacteria bacterium]